MVNTIASCCPSFWYWWCNWYLWTVLALICICLIRRSLICDFYIFLSGADQVCFVFVVVPCCHCVDSCCALSVSELHLQSLGLSGHVKRQAKVLRGTWARRIRWHVLYDSILSTSVYRCIQHLRHFQTQYLLLLHSILEFLITTPRFVALFDLTRCDYAKSKMCVRVSDQRPKVMLNKLKSNHILPWISKWDPLPYHTEIRWHDDWLMLCCIAPYLAAWDLILPM